MNWGIALKNYPLPEDFPDEYLQIFKQEMRNNISNGGHPKDDKSRKVFVKLCRIVDTFNGLRVDWDKTAEEYLDSSRLLEAGGLA